MKDLEKRGLFSPVVVAGDMICGWKQGIGWGEKLTEKRSVLSGGSSWGYDLLCGFKQGITWGEKLFFFLFHKSTAQVLLLPCP